MVKRRRLLTPLKSKGKVNNVKEDENAKDKEVSTARGRFKGALMDVLEPVGDASDDPSEDEIPVKHDRNGSHNKDYSSEEDKRSHRKRSPARQSYVLKLFDRSVDLSQFSEDSPLYPICRAWIFNQPKAIYKKFERRDEKDQRGKCLELPGPEGPPVSKIPEMLPEQKARNKDNINLNYREAPPLSKEELIQFHSGRWAGVRRAWLDQAARVEARYAATQQVLNESINTNVV